MYKFIETGNNQIYISKLLRHIIYNGVTASYIYE